MRMHLVRIRYDHEYPDYYPQAKANPQQADAGRSIQGLSTEFQCPAHWVRQAKQATLPGALSQEERAELARLRRQLKQAQMERDILAKAMT